MKLSIYTGEIVMNKLHFILAHILARMWLLVVVIITPYLLSACSKDDDDPPPFVPQVTLNAKLFVLGTQIDVDGNLAIYVNGTDSDDNPLTLAEFQAATVTVSDNVTSEDYSNDGTNLVIESVTEGEKILSVSLVTDYSGSMNDAELNQIGDVYRTILNSLPMVYELQIINFSDDPHLRLDWTEAFTDSTGVISTALNRDDSFSRNGTALFDSIGLALQRDLSNVGTPTTSGDGLIERCTPAHMLIVFSDGEENWSTTYTNRDYLKTLLDQSQTVPIMLGTPGTNSVEEQQNQRETLEFFAGDRGALVYVFDTGALTPQLENWTNSLQHLVRFKLSPTTQFDGNALRITLGNQSVTVLRPTDAFCELEP
jgi:hypothetical protein